MNPHKVRGAFSKPTCAARVRIGPTMVSLQLSLAAAMYTAPCKMPPTLNFLLMKNLYASTVHVNQVVPGVFNQVHGGAPL